MTTTLSADTQAARRRAAIRRWATRWGLALTETARVELADALAAADEQTGREA